MVILTSFSECFSWYSVYMLILGPSPKCLYFCHKCPGTRTQRSRCLISGWRQTVHRRSGDWLVFSNLILPTFSLDQLPQSMAASHAVEQKRGSRFDPKQSDWPHRPCHVAACLPVRTRQVKMNRRMKHLRVFGKTTAISQCWFFKEYSVFCCWRLQGAWGAEGLGFCTPHPWGFSLLTRGRLLRAWIDRLDCCANLQSVQVCLQILREHWVGIAEGFGGFFAQHWSSSGD